MRGYVRIYCKNVPVPKCFFIFIVVCRLCERFKDCCGLIRGVTSTSPCFRYVIDAQIVCSVQDSICLFISIYFFCHVGH